MTAGSQSLRMDSGKKQGRVDQSEDQIFTLLFDQDELSWQNIIMELIKTEKMDPWNVDVSRIAERFIELLTEMKKMDFRISGKVILAAAFFLKIKSDKLLKEDIAMLDNLIQPIDNPGELIDLVDNIPNELKIGLSEKPVLTFRSPQPRKRKVSVYDLIRSLEKALDTEQKKSFRRIVGEAKKISLKLPERKKDMTAMINEVFEKIKQMLKKVKVVWFYQLVEEDSKEMKITMFVPLLYLDTQRKIDLEQETPFGDIKINLAKPQ